MNNRKYVLVPQEKLDLLEELIDEVNSIVGEFKYNPSGLVSLPYWLAPKNPCDGFKIPTEEELKDIF